MPNYLIRGINVNFPYDAYDCQVVYMEKVIQCLQEGSNALLESPTGTGKTLCLLCATLAWRKSLGDFSTVSNHIGRSSSQQSDGDNHSVSVSQSGSQSTDNPRSNYPVIVYASRTHSQLKQVIRELRATNYRPKMSILGSREQLCIHEEVQSVRGRAQNNACQFLCKKRKCRHNNLVSEFMKSGRDLGNEPFDIEDLVKIGKSQGPCPYFISRELHKAVDILFAPYNYLIDPGNRRSLKGVDWNNAVLIFDEAHNLESICADAASFDLPSTYLTACISEAKECMGLCVKKRAIEKSGDKQHDPENYAILQALLLKMEKHIAEIKIDSKELGFTRPGDYIYEFLSNLNITYETANMLIDTVDNATLLLEEGNMSKSGSSIKATGTICRLETIRNILNIIFRDGGKEHAKFYRFHVQETKSSPADFGRGKLSRTLSWWCFNPGLAMQEFRKMGVRSIIMTSGTLSPLDSFALELNLDFPVRLENPHVISPNQVWVGVIPKGPSSYPFNSSYRTRDSVEYKQELGNAIVNFARIVPDGLLVFFPSYYLMDQCIDCWKSMSHASSTNVSTIWERICKNKQPVIEPKQSSLFTEAIEDFKAKLQNNITSGAIFFAVCRGKVSEGMDFADQAGRAVVVTGLPFSMKTDPKIRLKRDYLNQQAFSQKNGSKALTGEEWYVQQASRAVNQAVGRVIRHRDDHGAIILCDERFEPQYQQSQMSYWLQPHIKCYPKFGDAVFRLTRFFKDKASFSVLKSRPVEKSSIEAEPMVHHEIRSSLSISSLISKAEKTFRIPSSTIKVNDSSDLLRLDHIMPANRSNISNSNTHSPSLPYSHSRGAKSSTQSQENKIIDLTSDSSLRERPGVESIAPSSTKRPKIFKMINSSPLHAHNSLSLSTQISSPSVFYSTDSNRYAKDKGPQLNQVDSIDKKSESVQSTSKPNNSGVAKGSAFLQQVRDELGPDEYKEFVGLMQALKSKTMKITAVLERIAALFSTPHRFFLLEGFKDFVPVKYQPYLNSILMNWKANKNVQNSIL